VVGDGGGCTISTLCELIGEVLKSKKWTFEKYYSLKDDGEHGLRCAEALTQGPLTVIRGVDEEDNVRNTQREQEADAPGMNGKKREQLQVRHDDDRRVDLRQIHRTVENAAPLEGMVVMNLTATTNGVSASCVCY
jgi:hypothetical protein